MWEGEVEAMKRGGVGKNEKKKQKKGGEEGRGRSFYFLFLMQWSEKKKRFSA